MRDENRLILLAVLKHRTVDEQAELDRLIDKKLDWGYIAGRLTHHRLSGYFLRGLSDAQRNKLHYEFRIALELIVKFQAMQTREMMLHIMPVLELFDAEGIRYAALKGLMLNAALYSPGERRSNDSDILVREQDLDRIDELLQARGYRQSLFINNAFRPMTEEERIHQRKHYHDFPYVKPIGSDVLREHMIDLNIRFDSVDNDITEDIFAYGLVPYSGEAGRIWGLPWETNLAQLCVHFYREGSESYFVNGGADIVLYKIADIANVIKIRPKSADWFAWTELMHRWNLHKAAYFTLHHVGQVYPGLFDDAVLERLAPQDLSFMDEIRISDENRTEQRRHSILQTAFELVY